MTQLWWLSWVSYSDYPGGHQVYSVLCVRITIDELRRTHVMNESPQCLPFAFCVYGEILRNFLLHPSHCEILEINYNPRPTWTCSVLNFVRVWLLTFSIAAINFHFFWRTLGGNERKSELTSTFAENIYAMRTSNSKHFRAYIGIPVLTWTDMWKTLCMHNRTARPNEN